LWGRTLLGLPLRIADEEGEHLPCCGAIHGRRIWELYRILFITGFKLF
jgi:hypothetical protein